MTATEQPEVMSGDKSVIQSGTTNPNARIDASWSRMTLSNKSILKDWPNSSEQRNGSRLNPKLFVKNLMAQIDNKMKLIN